MAKGIKCFIIVNNKNGYCFQKEYFDSISKAVEYGRNFLGGIARRIYNDKTSKFIKRGLKKKKKK